MAYAKKPDWIDARCKCALSLNWNGQQSEALEVIEASIKELGENWEFLACNAIINAIIEIDWKADLIKAEETAKSKNEVCKFKQFIRKYGGRLSDQV